MVGYSDVERSRALDRICEAPRLQRRSARRFQKLCLCPLDYLGIRRPSEAAPLPASSFQEIERLKKGVIP
jgi:hypothetical protein